MKIKKYDVYVAGSSYVTTVYATCISKACKEFMATLKKKAKYKLTSKYLASIIYTDNHTICGDFVVMEQ
jgi:hypothetical protein